MVQPVDARGGRYVEEDVAGPVELDDAAGVLIVGVEVAAGPSLLRVRRIADGKVDRYTATAVGVYSAMHEPFVSEMRKLRSASGVSPFGGADAHLEGYGCRSPSSRSGAAPCLRGEDEDPTVVGVRHGRVAVLAEVARRAR